MAYISQTGSQCFPAYFCHPTVGNFGDLLMQKKSTTVFPYSMIFDTSRNDSLGIRMDEKMYCSHSSFYPTVTARFDTN